MSWNVLETPIALSRAQIAALHVILGDNARPAQPVNGRTVAVDTVGR